MVVIGTFVKIDSSDSRKRTNGGPLTKEKGVARFEVTSRLCFVTGPDSEVSNTGRRIREGIEIQILYKIVFNLVQLPIFVTPFYIFEL